MAAMQWPAVLVPSSEAWRLQGGARSGGQANDGSEQIVEAPASSRWAATITLPINTPARVKALRHVLALGRSQTWLVGPWEYNRAPWSLDVYGRKITPKLLRRPELDGTPYADAGAVAIANNLIPAAVNIDAPLNAVFIQVSRPVGTVFRSPDVVSAALTPLEPGMFFSIAGRLHTIVSVAGTLTGFRPWLRAAAPSGTLINFVSPKCTMRLASDDTGGLDLQLSRTGSAVIELIEAF